MSDKPRPEMKRLNSLINETDAAYHEAAVKLGLSDSALCILYSLAAGGGVCAVSDISSSGLSKQTANSALRKLEAEGVITLEAAGGRRKNIRLTRRGSVLTENTAARLIRAENEIFDDWDERDITAFIAMNEKYLKTFKEKLKEL